MARELDYSEYLFIKYKLEGIGKKLFPRMTVRIHEHPFSVPYGLVLEVHVLHGGKRYAFRHSLDAVMLKDSDMLLRELYSGMQSVARLILAEGSNG